MLTEQDSLAWAVTFAQANLDALSSGRIADLRTDLAVFYIHSIYRGSRYIDSDAIRTYKEYRLPSIEELHETHQQFAYILRQLLENGSVNIGTFDILIGITILPGGKSSLVTKAQCHSTIQCGCVRQNVYGLGVLIGDYNLLVKMCPAPKPRSTARCGTWFVGRPNQAFCSTQCQVRTGVRATRIRKDQSTPLRRAQRTQKV